MRKDPEPAAMYTPVVEDYLKAIWMLQQQESPVSTSRIAERLGLTAAAVTAMIKRLAEQGLLRHEPYYGVRLAAQGELAALRIIRRHRVLELFLAEKLGYEWDRVHDEAERLEHAASDELIERLARLMGEPERDPHGNAIPTAQGEVDTSRYPALGDLEPGDPRRVLEVEVEEPEQLRYLGSLDLYPGAEVEVVRKSPFEGPVSLQVNGSPQVISHSLAQRIRVRPDAGEAGG
jgi:DtxR family Mn-dependent transcriptional regulator